MMTPLNPVSVEDATSSLGSFLVESPLYTKLEIRLSEQVDVRSRFYPKTLRRNCEKCKVVTNWRYQGDFYKPTAPDCAAIRGLKMQPKTHAKGDLLEYRCVQCEKFDFAIWLRIEWLDRERLSQVRSVATHFTIQKHGQFPQFSTRPAAEIESALEASDVELYKRALMNMSAGYGLGAIAYLRRVVENETNRILDSLRNAAANDGDEHTAERIAAAMKSHSADERLRLAADATPTWLCIGGHNPLKLLYKHPSSALHVQDEDDCLRTARALLTVFESVLTGIRHHRKQQADIARALT